MAQGLNRAGEKIVHGNHLVPFVQEKIAEMRADEAGSVPVIKDLPPRREAVEDAVSRSARHK